MKVKIQIEAGCPSGRTKGGWNGTTTVVVDESLARDFVGNIMEYARQEAQAEHWQVEAKTYSVKVTYEGQFYGLTKEEIEEAIWVGECEIGKLSDGSEIRCDAVDIEIEEA
tara:strand:+ start:264 stop:596 length:333 start_codon:yes stop_codon:yes gene_type:complete